MTSFNDADYKKIKIETKVSTEDDDYTLGVLGVAHHQHQMHHHKKEFANEQQHSPRNQYRTHINSNSTSSRHHH
jgi:hypothetical protein